MLFRVQINLKTSLLYLYCLKHDVDVLSNLVKVCLWVTEKPSFWCCRVTRLSDFISEFETPCSSLRKQQKMTSAHYIKFIRPNKIQRQWLFTYTLIFQRYLGFVKGQGVFHLDILNQSFKCSIFPIETCGKCWYCSAEVLHNSRQNWLHSILVICDIYISHIKWELWVLLLYHSARNCSRICLS